MAKRNIPPSVTGKTFADLISECIQNPRAMSVILMVVPFVAYAFKIDKLENLMISLLMGVILNAIWFLFPLIIDLFKKLNL